MYQAKPVGSRMGISPVLKTFTVGATAIHFGDFVKLHTDGTVIVAAGGDTNILGVAVTPNDSSGDINVGASVQVNVTPGLMVLMDTTGGTAVKGLSYDFSGGTGAQIVDASGTAGNLLCWEVNPQGYGYDSDTSVGLFQLQETLYKV